MSRRDGGFGPEDLGAGDAAVPVRVGPAAEFRALVLAAGTGTGDASRTTPRIRTADEQFRGRRHPRGGRRSEAPSRGSGGDGAALDSVLDLVANDEAEIAVDYLVNTANAFRLPVRQDEYDRLLSAATRLDYADGVTEIDPTLLLPDPDGT